jgi:two-component system KDP operon response regulator KdpE
MTRILVVDDEPQTLRTLRILLSAHGHEVLVAADAAAALEAAARYLPDLILLDLGLPDLDGTTVIATLRAWSSVPVLVLSGRTDAADKVEALDAGADDYVTKPFSTDELMARLRALLRRTEANTVTDPVVTIGHYQVDLAAKTVQRTPTAPASAPEQVHLTKTEWAVLDILVRNPDQLVPGTRILRQVWGPTYQSETNYLRFYLAKLRQKLEPEPARPTHLITEVGMGYRYRP